MEDKRLKIGFNINESRVKDRNTEFTVAANANGGVDFIVVHCCNNEPDKIADAKAVAKAVKSAGCEFIANFEWMNFAADEKNECSFGVCNHPDGTHRLELDEKLVEALKSQGNLAGLMYDEFEHVIINRNVSIYMDSKFKKDIPVFPVPDTIDPVENGEILSSQIGDYVEKSKNKFGDMLYLGEHVFPALYHTFARNGITPNFKSQKESFSNLQFAVAAGASLEYGTKLWNCVDMWHMLTNPGHSANELYHNLKLAYLCGVNNVYVESASVFCDKDNDGNPYFNDIGRAFLRFNREYKNRDRDYDIHDYKPEIGIIRYDDTYWGQGRSKHFWRNMLFGNPKIKADYRAKEQMKIFHLLTHGESPIHSFYQGCIDLSTLKKHRSFATLNNTAVFDDRVKKETLESLKLCFICGYSVSDETMSAVRELVHDNGLTVVLPERFMNDNGGGFVTQDYREVKYGKGCFIVTDNFTSKALRKRLEAFLGEKDIMRFVFGNREIKLHISSDGESFDEV